MMKFLTENEAAHQLGVTTHSLRNMTEDGMLFEINSLYPAYLFNGDTINVELSFVSQMFKKKNMPSDELHAWLTSFNENAGSTPLEYIHNFGLTPKMKMIASFMSDIHLIAS